MKIKRIAIMIGFLLLAFGIPLWASAAEPSPTPAPGTYAAIFNPSPGKFTSGETGLRVGSSGASISNLPVPTHSGYTFGGWRLPNGNTLQGNLTLSGDVLLTAIWNIDPNATPTPTPNPTSGTGSGSSGSGQSSSLTNPETSPITISLMIFATMMAAGFAAIGITKISRRHMAAAGDYRSKMARYNREKRIADLVDDVYRPPSR